MFTGLLFKFADSIDVEFLPFYAWTGVWIGVLSIILASFDVACVIKHVTRFTDEIFSALISVIFILSAIIDLAKVHSDGTEQLCVSMKSLIFNMKFIQFFMQPIIFSTDSVIVRMESMVLGLFAD